MAPKRNRKVDRARRRPPLSEAALDFLIDAEKILDGYVARKLEREAGSGKPPRPPFDQAEGFLKRECYSLIQICIAGRKARQMFGSIVRHHDLEPPHRNYSDNPFYWGLISIDADRRILGAQRISRYAMQMRYADWNAVKPVHLVGFLYQIGGPTMLGEMVVGTNKHPSLSMANLEGGQSKL